MTKPLIQGQVRSATSHDAEPPELYLVQGSSVLVVRLS